MWRSIVLCRHWVLQKQNYCYTKAVSSVQHTPNSLESNGDGYYKMQVFSMCSKCVPHEVKINDSHVDETVKKDEESKPFILSAEYFKQLKPAVPVKMDMLGSSSQKLANLNETEQKVLKMIKMEYQVLQSTVYEIPFYVSDDDWVMLLQCQNFRDRKKYFKAKHAQEIRDLESSFKKIKDEKKQSRKATSVTRVPLVTGRHGADNKGDSLESNTDRLNYHTTQEENNQNTKETVMIKVSPVNVRNSADRDVDSSNTELDPSMIEETVYERNKLLARKSFIIDGKRTFAERMTFYWQKSWNAKQNAINVVLDINPDTPWRELEYVIYNNYAFDEACNLTICNTSKDKYLKHIEKSYLSPVIDCCSWRKERFYELFPKAHHKKMIYLTPTTNFVSNIKYSPDIVYVIGNRGKTDIQRDVNYAGIQKVKVPIHDIIVEKRQEKAQIFSSVKELNMFFDKVNKKKFEVPLEEYIIILKMLRRGHDWNRITGAIKAFEILS